MPHREVGFWIPLLALLGAVLIPAMVSLSLAGIAGVGQGSGLRFNILLVLYSLIGAPIFAWLLLPLLWPLTLLIAVKGWAGLASVIGLAWLIGVPSAHFILLGDVTTETPSAMPNILIALAIQAAVGWSILWGLIHRKQARYALGAQDG